MTCPSPSHLSTHTRGEATSREAFDGIHQFSFLSKTTQKMGLRKPHPAALEDGGKWLEVPQHLGNMFTSINSLDLGKIVTTNSDFMSWTARKVRK